MFKNFRLQGLRAILNMNPTGTALGRVYSWLPLSSLSPFFSPHVSECSNSLRSWLAFGIMPQFVIILN